VFIDVEFVPWRLIAVHDGCAVSVPLLDQGDALGIVNFYFTDSVLLTRQRLRLLATIAGATTPAIKNALLMEAFQAREQNTEFDKAAA